MGRSVGRSVRPESVKHDLLFAPRSFVNAHTYLRVRTYIRVRIANITHSSEAQQLHKTGLDGQSASTRGESRVFVFILSGSIASSARNCVLVRVIESPTLIA